MFGDGAPPGLPKQSKIVRPGAISSMNELGCLGPLSFVPANESSVPTIPAISSRRVVCRTVHPCKSHLSEAAPSHGLKVRYDVDDIGGENGQPPTTSLCRLTNFPSCSVLSFANIATSRAHHVLVFKAVWSALELRSALYDCLSYTR